MPADRESVQHSADSSSNTSPSIKGRSAITPRALEERPPAEGAKTQNGATEVRTSARLLEGAGQDRAGEDSMAATKAARNANSSLTSTLNDAPLPSLESLIVAADSPIPQTDLCHSNGG